MSIDPSGVLQYYPNGVEINPGRVPFTSATWSSGATWRPAGVSDQLEIDPSTVKAVG